MKYRATGPNALCLDKHNTLISTRTLRFKTSYIHIKVSLPSKNGKNQHAYLCGQ